MTESAGAPAPEPSGRALASRIARSYLLPRWRLQTVAVVCAAVVALMTWQLARIIEPAVNELLRPDNGDSLLIIPLAMVGLALARATAQVAQTTIVNRIGHRIVGDIQVQLFGR
jgi:subfamily B ATP-binding cassette protein MsbA